MSGDGRGVGRRDRWVVAANVSSGVFFVAGCVAFYFSRFYDLGVTLFLVGSVLMVLVAVADGAERRSRRQQ